MSNKKTTKSKNKTTKSAASKKKTSSAKTKKPTKTVKTQPKTKSSQKKNINKILKNNSISAAILFLVLLLAIMLLVKYADFGTQQDQIQQNEKNTLAEFSSMDISYKMENGSLKPVLENTGNKIKITDKEYEFIEKLFKISGMKATEKNILEEAAVRDILYYNSKNLADKKEIEENVDMLLSEPNVQKIITSFNMSKEQFNNAYRKELKKDYLIQQFLKEEIAEKVPKAEARNTSHILVCFNGSQICNSNRTKEEAFERANMIQEKAENNNTRAYFASLAKEYSDGPSGTRGGYLGMLKKGQMVAKFEEINFNLEEKEISEPVETSYGYHIIRVSSISKVPDMTTTTNVLYDTRSKIIENIEIK
ncbi:MAG: peptidylprolyl isomerase [Nanobdellota archaeon]